MQAASKHLNPAVESEPGYGQLFEVLIRRKFILLGILTGVVGLATVATFLTEPTYISGMQLLVEPNYQGKRQMQQTLENTFSDTNVEIDNATQINLMQSSILLRKAMTLLQADYPDLDPDDPESVADFKKQCRLLRLFGKLERKMPQRKFFRLLT